MLASILVRIALAEVFGGNCPILALDEPTTNLDVNKASGERKSSTTKTTRLFAQVENMGTMLKELLEATRTADGRYGIQACMFIAIYVYKNVNANFSHDSWLFLCWRLLLVVVIFIRCGFVNLVFDRIEIVERILHCTSRVLAARSIAHLNEMLLQARLAHAIVGELANLRRFLAFVDELLDVHMRRVVDDERLERAILPFEYGGQASAAEELARKLAFACFRRCRCAAQRALRAPASPTF